MESSVTTPPWNRGLIESRISFGNRPAVLPGGSPHGAGPNQEALAV